MKYIITFLLAALVTTLFMQCASAGELTYTFTPPTHRTPSPDYPEGKVLDPSEIDHYNGVVRQSGSTAESTFTVPGDATSFVLPDLVAGEYCVKLSTTDKSTPPLTDGFSEEKCKTVPEGPLTAPLPPDLHGVDPITFNVPATDWKVVYASSFELENWHMPPEGAFDRGKLGNAGPASAPHEIWHSRYSPDEALPPHEIQIDMGQTYTVVGFIQKPRENAGNGTVKDYAFQLSTDGISWTQVAGGTFPDGADPHTVEFPEMQARYFKFVGLSEQDGGNQVAVDELYILARTSDYITIEGGGVS